MTTTIGQRASILQCLDLPIENALGLVKFWEVKALSDFDPQTNSILVFRPRFKIATAGAMTGTHRQTDASDLIICPMLCYSNETDKYYITIGWYHFSCLASYACIDIQRYTITNSIKCWWKLQNRRITSGIFETGVRFKVENTSINYTIKHKRETENVSNKSTTVVQTTRSLYETLSEEVVRHSSDVIK